MKIYDNLLPNSMSCHHHTENEIVINHKGQQYFQLVNR
jgi:cupin superfamily acireductone dioxygenase involved in methionine salvage